MFQAIWGWFPLFTMIPSEGELWGSWSHLPRSMPCLFISQLAMLHFLPSEWTPTSLGYERIMTNYSHHLFSGLWEGWTRLGHMSKYTIWMNENDLTVISNDDGGIIFKLWPYLSELFRSVNIKVYLENPTMRNFRHGLIFNEKVYFHFFNIVVSSLCWSHKELESEFFEHFAWATHFN